MKPTSSRIKKKLIPLIEKAESIAVFNDAFFELQRELEDLDSLAPPLANNMASQVAKENRRKFVKAFNNVAAVDISKIADPTLPVTREKVREALESRGGRRVSNLEPRTVPFSSALIDKNVPKTLTISVEQNIALIKTIPPQHLYRVRHYFDQVFAGGGDVGLNLKWEIQRSEEISERRAKLIARDQIQKLMSALNQGRQRDLGITGYIWRTSQDERVRDSHEKNDGKRFNWNAPPAETGHPGEDVQCRCYAEPDMSTVLPWQEQNFKKDN